MYKHILLAVDLTQDSKNIAIKAVALAKLTGAEFSVIHVQEPIRYAYASEAPIDYSQIQTQIDGYAQKSLDEFVESLEIEVKHSLLESGKTSSTIRAMADNYACDLIVVGSHGRHGFSLIFGSHSSGVIHGATCDVMAIRV
ncbi:MAG: universal stress protein [Saccharospirillaceae bacterium]|nr:universal stress protein [Pseudomonadales bacterium]NRB78612.1 universal stress protein [Saccharospirillaceae bacterium]